MSQIDSFGNMISTAGLVLTATGIGAEIGIPLISIGNGISLVAKGMYALSYAYEKRFLKAGQEGVKIFIEEYVTKRTRHLIKPIGKKGINQKIGSEINSRATSEIIIPALEGQTRTVN